MPGDPAHLSRLDNDDTAFNTWVVAWVAHQLAADPLRLFEAPIFHPARDTLAFSEHMLVPSLMGAPLLWAGASPVLVYNGLVWAGLALSGFAMALVMRRWTGSTVAAIVAGSLYAFNAHLLTRYSHLQALHIEFLPGVLYAFDRLLGSGDARMAATTSTPSAIPWRPALLLVALFVLQALCSNYTLVMMTAALLAAFVVRPEPWRGRGTLWIVIGACAVAAALVLLPFLLPYSRVRAEQGLARTMEEVRLYSAGWLDYLVTAGRLHYAWWSHRFFDGRTALFPGFTGLGLTALAVATGIAWTDRRARMAAAFGLLGFALSFGASLPGYGWMQEHVPLLQGIRAVARWGFLLLVAVAILSGFAVAWVERRWGGRTWWPAVAVALIGLVTLEALRAPLPMERFAGIPSVHQRLRQDEVKAIVVFPLYAGSQFNRNAAYMLHQTRHWKPMLNAYSSFAPPSFYRLAETLQSFPDAASLEALRAHGFSHVVLHRAPLEREFGKAAVDGLRAHPELQFMLEQDGVIVYRVR